MAFLKLYMFYISPAFIFVPVIVGFLRYKALTITFKVLLGFLLCSCVSNVANIILSFHHIPTTTLFHLFTVFEFAFTSWMYATIFDKRWRKTIAVMVSVFTVLCILNYFFLQNGIETDTYTGTLEAIIIIGYSLLFLYQQSNIENHNHWGQNAFNWINIAILIYFGCGFFMFISLNYIMHAGLRVNLIVWSVFDTILVFESLLFAIGFYKCST